MRCEAREERCGCDAGKPRVIGVVIIAVLPRHSIGGGKQHSLGVGYGDREGLLLIIHHHAQRQRTGEGGVLGGEAGGLFLRPARLLLRPAKRPDFAGISLSDRLVVVLRGKPLRMRRQELFGGPIDGGIRPGPEPCGGRGQFGAQIGG